jgi:hypothetical protein
MNKLQLRIFLICIFIIQGISAQVKDTILSNSNDTIQKDMRGRNMYGDLLDDDPLYNKRYPVIVPAVRVIAADAFNWALARYVYDFDWARISTQTWKDNLKRGFHWDVDNFGINFIGHPHTGNYYFNVARSNGYSFWQSLPFAIEGSLVWEYFGEKDPPSLNDLINTPLSGMFLGEIFYRISSNVLDDRKRRGRVWRELLALAINPSRGLNRFTQGKMWRIAPYDIYQREPLNFTFNVGAHRINNHPDFPNGTTNAILNAQLDYGNPFEVRRRKPFDVFRLRTELSYGAKRRLLENVNGYGILTGRNTRHGSALMGIFQHFDYWNNNTFEIGTLGYGAGLISQAKFFRKSNIYSNIHIAAVPLAGNNTRFGPDTSDVRKYNFGGGFQVKLEETINISDWLSMGFTGFFFWIHTYNGLPGNSLVGIFRPTVAVKLFKNVSLGFEHHIYQNDRFLQGKQNLHLTRTEEKVFLQIFIEDKQRSGKYH